MSFDPVTYTRCLAKKMTNELGFIPESRYSDAVPDGRLLIQTLNEEPCGFLFFGKPKNGRIKVWQTAIQVDARAPRSGLRLARPTKTLRERKRRY